MKSKHKWHCGICESDLIPLKKGKGTKYLHCPNCDKIVAYYNKGLLRKVAKGALRSLPGGDIIAELLPEKSSTPSTPPAPTRASKRMSETEKLERYISLNKQR